MAKVVPPVSTSNGNTSTSMPSSNDCSDFHEELASEAVSVTTCDSTLILCHAFFPISYVLWSIALTLFSLTIWTSYSYSPFSFLICLYLHLWPRAFPSCHVSDIMLVLVMSCLCTRIPSCVSLSLFLCWSTNLIIRHSHYFYVYKELYFCSKV